MIKRKWKIQHNGKESIVKSKSWNKYHLNERRCNSPFLSTSYPCHYLPLIFSFSFISFLPFFRSTSFEYIPSSLLFLRFTFSHHFPFSTHMYLSIYLPISWFLPHHLDIKHTNTNTHLQQFIAIKHKSKMKLIIQYLHVSLCQAARTLP